MSDDEGLQIVSPPKAPRAKKVKEPVVAATAGSVPMDAKYLDKLNKAREQALVKKAKQRMEKEEEAINAKVAELKKQKEIELPPVVAPVLIPEPAPVPVPVAPVATPKPKAVRKKPVPKPEKIVERIVEVEKIVYQAPKLNFCFV
jgi:hypothetical protein